MTKSKEKTDKNIILHLFLIIIGFSVGFCVFLTIIIIIQIWIKCGFLKFC